MPDDTIDLTFLARQIETVITQVRSLQADMLASTAIVQRLDNTVGDLLTEVRTVHSQLRVYNQRIEPLEAQP